MYNNKISNNLDEDGNIINTLNQTNQHRSKDINFNLIIEKIEKILKKYGRCNDNEMENYLKNELRDKNFEIDDDFKNKIKNYEKIEYINNNFYLRKKYKNIHNIEDLNNLIKESENGLKIDDELYQAYNGIKKDIEEIKKEKKVRIINNKLIDEKNKEYKKEKEKNKTFEIMFYRNIQDKIEELIINPNLEQAINELRKIWKKDDLKIKNNERDYIGQLRYRNKIEQENKKNIKLSEKKDKKRDNK
jgi:hypothetical protein